MPVLTMPGKPAVRSSLIPSAVFRKVAAAIGIAHRPVNVPRWAFVIAVAALAFGGFLVGRQRPAHHYVAYFGYPMVLDTTTGKACYAAPPTSDRPATAADPAFPADGTANQFDSQETAGPQIPLCGQE